MSSIIMIVDDMKLNIDILAENLRDTYKIMPATSGETAMKMLERRKPDLVLLDIFMPNIDGFDVLKFIKEREELRHIPVIFVTGEISIETEEKGYSLGASDYIKKPFNPIIIRAKIKNQLKLNEYRNNLQLLAKKRIKRATCSYETLVMGMSLFLSDNSDNYADGHISRIKRYTRILADKMLESCPNIITTDLAWQTILFSPMYDIGKCRISVDVTNKTGIFTAKDYELMKNHTVEGATMLRKIASLNVDSCEIDDDAQNPLLKVAIEIAEFHHEKFDGSGYPYGLKGEEIPVSARIVALADVYDALRSSKPYKQAHTHEESVEIIFSNEQRTNAAHFDPNILNVFKYNHLEFKKVYDC